jgi:hypothetical protein
MLNHTLHSQLDITIGKMALLLGNNLYQFGFCHSCEFSNLPMIQGLHLWRRPRFFDSKSIDFVSWLYSP